MPEIYVVTTSYPERQGDAQGHFVAAEVRRLGVLGNVTVLAPGAARRSLGGERVVGLAGGSAFGFPGALQRLREDPRRWLEATEFVAGAVRWLRAAPTPTRLVAHFLLPCGVPIATRGLRAGTAAVEVVVHGSDARLFAQLPLGQRWLARQLIHAGARLRFVSSELQALVLDSLPARERSILRQRSRVEPCAIDVGGAPSRERARRLLELPNEGRLAVVVARLVESKRVHVALEACERVAGLQSIVVGDGPERDRLMRRFPNARFVGHVERPLALSYVAAADVLVSASLNEGAPTVVREARALGTPVVCLAAGDVRRWAASDPGIHVAP